MRFLPTLLLPLLLTAAPTQATRRVGEAEVREGANGVPCFTISEREEKRSGTPDFQAVTVNDASGKLLWKMAMPHERTFPVTYSMCIPYAGRVQALPQTPAAVLEAGKVYQVLIEARRTKNATRPLRYAGRFCIGPEAGAIQATAPAMKVRNGCLAGTALAR